MRTVFAAVLFLAACSGVAQSETRYDLYIFQAGGGAPDVYAFSGGQNAVAVEVRGCGDVSVLPNGSAVASDLSARRRGPDISVVTIESRGSRTFLGPCGEGDDDEAKDDEEAGANDGDSLVVIENASARQMRRMIQSFDAAPAEVREQISATLGLS